jgi:hypothetical protein
MFEIPGSEIQGVVRISKQVVEDHIEPIIEPFKAIRQEKSA